MTVSVRSLQRFMRPYIRRLAKQQRDARYVFVLIGGAVVFLLTYLHALSNGLLDSFERPVFNAINGLPDALHPLFFAATQFGGLGSLILWTGTAWYLINRRAAITTMASGISGWFLAKLVKETVQRGRPGSLLDSINLFDGETFGGYGFPSGHATFSAACATILYYQVAPRYRKYILSIVFSVGLSRMYLGAHFPLDVIGGWALGATLGALILLIFGTSRKGLSAVRLKKFLNKRGYAIQHLTFAQVDARGSRPVFITLEDGREYFAKIFGKQEHAADWLFKIYRFFRYKNLQAEEPYVNSRRNIELEAFATLWARQGGVRTAKVIETLNIGRLWVLMLERVVGSQPLSDIKHFKQSTLEDAWKQVKKLHNANMAHRDLRAANLLVDRKDQVWLIDFGFAEVSPNRQRFKMDIAELLMSMSLLVGPKRTIVAASKAFSKRQLAGVPPYLQMAVFSGETARQIRKNRAALQDLKDTLKEHLDITEDIDKADVLRINGKQALNLTLIAIFLYAVIPQFNDFKGTFDILSDISSWWLVPIALSSAFTYPLTGFIYVILADVPLKVLPTAAIQLAASFMSKIIPGGIGSSTLNARYLTKAGLGAEETSAVLVSQGVLSFLMFTIPLAIFLVVTGGNVLELFKFHTSAKALFLILVLLCAAAITIYLVKTFRKRLLEASLTFIASLREITTSPRQLSLACTASLAVTFTYMFCLYACARAVGVPLDFVSIVAIYATATIARAAIPTPGGLGPLEVAMVSGLIGLGIDKPEAFSVVILYRLATFWLPIPFSLLAYTYASNKKLI